jgi:hypothetical protein
MNGGLLYRFPIASRVVESYRERLTPRGKYILWTTAALAVLGLNTKENQVFKLFAVVAAMLVLATVFALLRAPRVDLTCRLPLRATARRPLKLQAMLGQRASEWTGPLLLSFPRPRKWGSSISFSPRQVLHSGSRDGPTEATVTFEATRRGKYELRGPSLRLTDPLALVGGRAKATFRSDDDISRVGFRWPRTRPTRWSSWERGSIGRGIRSRTSICARGPESVSRW